MALALAPAWEDRGFRTVTEQVGRLRDFAANPKQRVPTGLAALDAHILGPAWGEVFMFLGRSFTGKSLIATNLMANNPDKGIIFFSLEMPEHQVLQRLWAHVSDVSASEVGRLVRKNMLPDSLESQLGDYVNHVIVDKGNLNTDDMSAYVSAYEAYFSRKPDLVIVDYLELVGGGKSNAEGWQNTEGNASRLKDWAKSEQVGVVVLHQANRTSTAPWEPPNEGSARGGGYTESDAVIGIWRPGRDPKLPLYERKIQQHDLHMNVIKNRVNGKTTVEDLKYRISDSMRLVEISRPKLTGEE